MSSDRPNGRPPSNKKNAVEEADALNHVIAKLSVLGDFIKILADDSFFFERDTPLGLYLIMGECIDKLKKIGGV